MQKIRFRYLALIGVINYMYMHYVIRITQNYIKNIWRLGHQAGVARIGIVIYEFLFDD